jgi:aryl-alcohol dehydrogenase-like predicted oxidoreductase
MGVFDFYLYLIFGLLIFGGVFSVIESLISLLEKEKIDKVKKLASVAKELNCTLAQMSIAWCALNPNVSTVILGATKKEQLNDNLKSLEIVSKLTPAIIDKIEKIMKNKPTKASF